MIMVVRLFCDGGCLVLDRVIEMRVLKRGYLIDRIKDGYREKIFEDKRKWHDVEVSDRDMYNEVYIY